MQGLWMSSNMNAATPTWNKVTSYPFRQPERVYFNPFNKAEMWVSSFGNGMKIGSSASVTPTYTAELNDPEQITVYPNPAGDLLNIVVPQIDQPSLIEIFNITGIKMVSFYPVPDSAVQVKTGSWPTGIYIVKTGGQSVLFSKE
jgi:hypothetical protein